MINVNKLLQRKAKQYPKLPFEMKILFVIAVYIVSTLIAIGDSVLFLISWLKKGLLQLFAYTQKIFSILSNLLQNASSALHSMKKTPIFSRVTKTKTGFLRLFVGKKRPLSLLPKRHKKKLVALYTHPLTFRQKLWYFSFGSVFSCLFFFLPLLFLIFVQNLPSPYELTIREIPQTTKILSRDGTLLKQIYASQNRTLVQLQDIPLTLQQATLAIEDKNFYSHPGFDIVSIFRALKENLSGGNFQGGSTLTQQLIKSAMLTPEPSIMRKIKEITLAFWAERIYSKKQIMQMYFNQVPYGGTAWGVEAAAEVYFGKPVKQLNLPESAFLAGITAAPTAYSPYGDNPTAWKVRQKEVLLHMLALHYITADQKDAALKEELHFKSQDIPEYAPHFVNYITDLLIKKYGLATVEKGGLTVVTSLDIPTQQMAQKIVTDEVNNSAYLNLTNGATVVTSPQTGDILAMVGSKDYANTDFGKVNIATSQRQPGSSIKVVTYSAALSHGLSAATIIEDTPTAFPIQGAPAYTPVNYDGHYFGKIPLRFALANSLNVPAVKTLQQIGIPTMVSLARDMGISSWDTITNFGLSVTLGGKEVTMLDMATVFSTLANQGERVDLNPVLKITDASGKIYEEKTTAPRKRVLSNDVAFIISDILADAKTRSYAFGPASPLEIRGHTVSVKTGTTDSKRDNWAIGYTNNYTVAVWVGNNDNSPMSPTLASGITGAAPIWHKVMENLLSKNPETRFSVPTTVTQKPCLGRIEYFVKGTEGSTICGFSPKSTTYSALPRQ